MRNNQQVIIFDFWSIFKHEWNVKISKTDGSSFCGVAKNQDIVEYWIVHGQSI